MGISNTTPDTRAGISTATDHASIADQLQQVSQRLHGIASRSEYEQIAAEVMRLNDSVRAEALKYRPVFTSPAEFLPALLHYADRYPD